MRDGTCEQCGSKRPLGEMFQVFGRSLCQPCADADVAGRQSRKIPPGAVSKLSDPTVCSGCGRDNGNFELAQLGGGVPVCADCEQKFRNPVFPPWIRVSFAALLLMAALCSMANWRFLSAHLDLRRGMRRAEAGDARGAAAEFAAASRQVPESDEVAGVSAFYQGLALITDEKPTEALEYLRKVPPAIANNPQFADVVLTAEAGTAFDRKDYDQFLAKSNAMLARHPSDARALAGVSSAHACKWAATGDASSREAALDFLDRARRAAPPDGQFRAYEGRILYRIDSRDVISRQEYERRFPRGYVRQGGHQ